MGVSQGLDTGQIYKFCNCLPLDQVATKRGIEGLKQFHGLDYAEYIDLTLEI